ncbi:FomA family porin-like outer membrane protein [Psychrilyobacter atlanticus]|uniref:FomA family porin-like outer membrane protein n=1 Tax=Psychrilyobacter atlanticus TaxID=271091 RepID=UPI0003F9B49E|nr:hypothetical protein [Psychrilyobacter atlanticus]
MNVKKIAVLAGLMTMGMITFAMEDSDAEVLTQEEKQLSIFNINDRVRFDENRLEMNGNFHLNKSNRLEMRLRHYSDIGYGSFGDTRESGNTADNRTEIRLRLHTQTSVENMVIRTELKTNTYGSGDGGNQQYFRVQPTWQLFADVENLSSYLRAGVGFKHTSPKIKDTTNDYSFTSSFENFYTINNYLAVEGNVYYDYTFVGEGSDDYNNVDIEAYVYANYPLYKSENGMKLEALLEGGFDPYSFGARHFTDLNNVSGSGVEGHETYVLYAEPSIQVSKLLDGNNSVFLQGGYYVEKNEKNSTGNVDDTAFIRFGYTSKF